MSPGERFSALARCRRGAVAVEGALFLVVLMIVGGLVFDAARYLRTAARIERAAFALADMATRSEALRDRIVFDAETRNEDLGALFEMARQLAAPTALDEGGGTLIASVTPDAAGWTVNWARASAGALLDPGWFSAPPALPPGKPMIVVEIVAPFGPAVFGADLALGAVGMSGPIRGRAFFRPRAGSLTRLDPP